MQTDKLLVLLSIVAVALCLVPSGAHLFEMPNKLQLARADYLAVQQIYRGWALFGVIVVATLLLTVTLAVRTRGSTLFPWTLTAAMAVIAALAVFFAFTFPTNQRTTNWTVLPENWEQLRRRWEYSHAAAALLNFTALLSLLGAAHALMGEAAGRAR